MIYTSFVKPLLLKLEHENAKDKTSLLLHILEKTPLGLKIIEQFAYKHKRFTDKRLQTTLAGITLDNPLMLGAGWDKVGHAIRGLHALGFSAIEVGTVTAYPQSGNFKPRLHAIGEGVSLNSYGFPSPGMEVVARNLERYKNDNILIGVNVGKNKYIPLDGMPYMHAVVIRRLYNYAKYFTLGISSPNTPGIKNLQKKKYLRENIREIHTMMDEIGFRKPLFIKIAPEIDEHTLDGVLEVIFEENLAGIIAVNTYTQKNILGKYGQRWEERPGGIGGNDEKYKNIATKKISQIYTKTQGKVPIIGVGGIHDLSSALEKIAAGATALQLLTGLFFEGPTLPGKINRGLVEFMEKEHIKNLEEIRGQDARKILDNKNAYSFAIHTKNDSLEQLKREYMQAVFRQNNLNTLLISKNPFQLKHGELGRNWSHIYLNHRIPLFQNIEYRKLFAKIMDRIIDEQLVGSKNYTIVSVPSSGSPELTSAIQTFSNKEVQRVVLLPKHLIDTEKGTKTSFYGNLGEICIMADDVFTSGKTMKQSFQILSKSHINKIYGVSLVARNTETLNTVNKQIAGQIVPFLTLDEILQYHWKNFSSLQKQIIQKERVALN